MFFQRQVFSTEKKAKKPVLKNAKCVKNPHFQNLALATLKLR